MDLLIAACLGIVQGLTEFLPVSSTAHLLIGAHLLEFDDPGGVFTVTIQFGSVLAVVWLYRVRIFQVLAGLQTDPGARRFATAIAIAFLPAAVLGVAYGDFIKGVLYESPMVFATAFVVGGIVMLLVERFRPAPNVHNAGEISWRQALGIGLAQTLALVPGASRSGATMIGGVLARLDRGAAAEFSFFLAIPTMGGAFVHDLWEVRGHLTAERATEIGIGFVMAFIAAALVVRPFLAFVTRAGFGPFAWYRIGIGVALFAAVWGGWSW